MDIKKCVITAGGRGTRMLPITKSVCKEMLPIVNEPAIFLQVKECFLSGIEEVIIVTNKDNYDLINSFFKKDVSVDKYLDSKKRELLNEVDEILDKMNIRVVVQDENLRGSAGALYAAKDYINEDYFGLIFCDDLVLGNKPLLKELIDKHKDCNTNVVAISKVPEKLLTKFGLIKFGSDEDILDFISVEDESNIPSDYTLRGRLIISKDIFKYILDAPRFGINEVGIPRVMIRMNSIIKTVKIDNNNYFDVGSPLGFIKANVAYGLKNDKINIELDNYLKSRKDDKYE